MGITSNFMIQIMTWQPGRLAHDTLLIILSYIVGKAHYSGIIKRVGLFLTVLKQKEMLPLSPLLLSYAFLSSLKEFHNSVFLSFSFCLQCTLSYKQRQMWGDRYFKKMNTNNREKSKKKHTFRNILKRLEQHRRICTLFSVYTP